MKPVCLVLGAGAGIGGNVAKSFPKRAFIYVFVVELMKKVSII